MVDSYMERKGHRVQKGTTEYLFVWIICCVQQHFYYYCYFIESVSVCAFQFIFWLNVSRATNFIYIAHLGIVIEQKIVLTFRITFTMWNSFTQSIGMKALRREPKHTKKNRLSMDRFFHIHVFGYAWRWFKMICYFWCGVPYYSIQSVCSVAVDCWLDDLIIFT